MLIQGIRTAIHLPPPPEPPVIYNRTGLGFWRVPDHGFTGSAAVMLRMLHVATGAAGSAAVTLRMLRDSGIAQLGYEGPAAITLKALSAHGEVRYGPDNNPGRITLKRLAVAGNASVLAPVAATHTILYKYNARDGGPIATWLKSYQGSRQVQIKRTVPAGTSSQEFDVVILEATTISLTVYSTQDVSIVLNDDASQTIDLPAREPIIWTSDSGLDFPFVEDVSKLFVTNAGLSDASFTISALILDHSN